MAQSKLTKTTVQAMLNKGEGVASQVGLGVDIVEVARMEKILKRTPRFAEKMFSSEECEYARKKAKPAAHLALFFAAREAVVKALGCGFAGIGRNDISISHDRAGRPVPVLSGRAAEIAAEQGIVEIQLSLSYTHQVGVASAVAIKSTDRPRPNKKRDPMAELKQQFKEMRAMLSEMDARISEQEAKAGDLRESQAESLDEERGKARQMPRPDSAGDGAWDSARDDKQDAVTDEVGGGLASAASAESSGGAKASIEDSARDSARDSAWDSAGDDKRDAVTD
jgi:holo-[acyl-carrier protein] synthase